MSGTSLGNEVTLLTGSSASKKSEWLLHGDKVLLSALVLGLGIFSTLLTKQGQV